jgi:hypothetical protein
MNIFRLNIPGYIVISEVIFFNTIRRLSHPNLQIYFNYMDWPLTEPENPAIDLEHSIKRNLRHKVDPIEVQTKTERRWSRSMPHIR